MFISFKKKKRLITSNCGRALIVQVISAGACVSGRGVSFSKCS